MGKQFLNGIVVAEVTALPSAAPNNGAMLRQGGKIWFSNGTAWVDLTATGSGGGGLTISTVDLNISTMSEIFDATVAVPGVVTANKIKTWVEGNQSSQNATDDAYVASLSAYARVSATDQITFTIRSATPFKGPVRLSYFIY